MNFINHQVCMPLLSCSGFILVTTFSWLNFYYPVCAKAQVIGVDVRC